MGSHLILASDYWDNATYQLPDTGDMLLVSEGEIGVVPEEVKQAQGLGNVEPNIVPILKVLGNLRKHYAKM